MITRPRILSLVLATLCLSLFAWSAAGVTVYQIQVDAGSTTVQVGGEQLLIKASAPVIVYIRMDSDTITGDVESADGSSSTPRVQIVLLGPPDKIIFDGRVDGSTPFVCVYPTGETGHAEM